MQSRGSRLDPRPTAHDIVEECMWVVRKCFSLELCVNNTVRRIYSDALVGGPYWAIREAVSERFR